MAGFQRNSYYAWWAAKATQRLLSKLAHGSKQRGCCGVRSPPPITNTMLAWLVSKTKTSYAVKQACTSGGGRVSERLILCMASFKNDPEAVKQACRRLKLGGRGLGGGSPPPICKHNARMVGFRNTHMLSSKLAQAGVGGAAPLAW